MGVYEIRPEMKELCRAVILGLYDFIDMAEEALLDRKRVEKIRNNLTKEFKLTPPRNIELLEAYRELLEEGRIDDNTTIFNFLVKRKVRTESGIANITVLMKAYGCPGQCIYCPSQPKMPKSYFSKQPAMMRAVRNNFNCYKQMKTRLNGLKTQGHDISKIDVRTAGGTWGAYAHDYQEFFVKSIYFALNEGDGEFLEDEEATRLIEESSLAELIEINETTKCRCVGLWVETRPDWIDPTEIKRLRRFGVTGIELGLQTTNDKVNEFNKRGHSLEQSIEATKMCRDAGLKICHHIMPNLPTSTPEIDLQTVSDLFEKDILQPDYIKVYPCMVLPYTKLAKMVEEDSSIHTPYSDQKLFDILVKIKSLVPRHCRIIRILRDFPSNLVLQGTKTLNMRQILAQKGVHCECIRCREIKGDTYDPTKVELRVEEYPANQGQEFFISLNSQEQDKLIGLCRLRLPEKGLDFIPELKGAALIRELHVYGTQKSLNNQSESRLKSKTQHKGYGKQLMQKAEEIASQNGFTRVAVISAIGTREYYKKLGYELEGDYMVKSI